MLLRALDYVRVACNLESYVFFVTMLLGLTINADIAAMRLYIFHQKSRHQPVNDFSITFLGVAVVIIVYCVHGIAYYYNTM